MKTVRPDLLPPTHGKSHIFTLFSWSQFDFAFGQSGPQDIVREIKHINRLYVISGTALWFQQFNMIHLSENWSEIFLLEDYLVLIENPDERNRISAGRDSLISQKPGFEWADTFTLHAQTVRTTAVVADGCIFGMDRVVGCVKNID